MIRGIIEKVTEDLGLKMTDEEGGVWVASKEEDTEVRKECAVHRKWQAAQCGLRASRG